MLALFALWWLGAAPRVKIERFSKAGWEAAVAAGGKFPAWQAAVLAGEKFRPCVGKGATTDEWCDCTVKEPPGMCPARLLRLLRPYLAALAGPALPGKGPARPRPWALRASLLKAADPSFDHSGATATATRSHLTATPSCASAPSGTAA